jgi:hypothetical protein
MPSVNVETLKVNITTVVTIVVASFSLYFFIGGLIEAALIEAKVYALTLDIDRDEEAAAMYKFRIDNGIANPNDPARLTSLQEKINRQMVTRTELKRGE